MRKKVICAVLSLILLFVLTSETSLAESNYLISFKGLKGKIDIAGGTAHIPIMKEAAMRIMSYNPNIRITVAGGGSGVGVQKVGQGLVDIGNTGRPLTPEERAKYGLKSYAFAIDGVAVIVHPSNPVKSLTTKQIQDIFAGNIKNWNIVGGKNLPIHLYTRDEASGTRAVFWKKLLKKRPISQNANVVPSNGAMKVAISRDRNGIGYISVGYIDYTISPIKVDGIFPSQENVKKGIYKVVRKLYMNTKGEPNKLVKTFINYILSPEGAEIIKKHGFIPISNCN